MARFVAKVCLLLQLLTFLVCLVMHVATFLAVIPPIWILLPFVTLGISVVIGRMVRDWLNTPTTLGSEKLGLVLFAYAIVTCIYVYRETGGASSVALQNGIYVSLYKDHVVKTLTREEFIRIPNLWTRALSAWLGAIAWFSAF